MAERHDQRQTRRRNGQCAADHRIRQHMGTAHSRPSHDAKHGNPDASGHQGQGAGHLSGYVYIDLHNITPSDYVEKAREFLAKSLILPPGYSIEWTGVYKYADEARARMWVIIPVTLMIIFGLLVLAFRSVSESVLT